MKRTPDRFPDDSSRMDRRRFLSIAACAVGAPLAACAGALAEMPPTLPRDYACCLPDHLRDLAARARAVRELALADLTTAEAVRRRQGWVTETLWSLAGGRPERAPPAIRGVGALVRQGYRLEKLVYESRPSFPITANLYVPTGRRGPFPGVLFQCGHRPQGKAAPA
jgi:hypothetical protein